MNRVINLFLTLCLLCYAKEGTSQKTSKIVNQGPVPIEFISPAKTRFEAAKNTIDASEKKSIRKAKTSFYLQSNYQLDYLLKSGKVVFNEEIHQYLNKVLAILIKEQPALEGKIKLYPIKLDYANAFTFNEGYIFVNIGLLARLNNEAELAFILGHEIKHFDNQHSIKKQLKKLQIKEDDSRFKLSRYSRIHEFEADKEGYELFAKTGYNKNAAVSALEMLFISNQPYAERKFNFEFFEKGSLFIPQIDSSKRVKSEAKQFDLDISEEEADSLATHPALEDRIREIKSLSDKANKEGPLFIATTEEQFLKIQQICRIEMARMFILDKDYQKAIYHLFLLKKDYPNSQEIDLLIAIFWGKLSFDLENKTIKEIMPAPVLKNNVYVNGIIEEEEYLRRVISGFSREEIQLIAIKHIYLVSVANPQLASLKTLCSKIIQSYRGNFGRSISDFETIENFSKENVLKLYMVKDEPEQTEKSARIRKAKAKKRKFDFENSFAKFALSDLFAKDEEFKKLFNSFKAGKVALDKDDEGSEDSSEKEISSNIKTTNKKKSKPKAPDNLGVDRMILLEPQYSKKDLRKKEPIDLVGNEATQIELINTLTTAGQAAGMKIICLTPNAMESSEIEKYNDMALLKSWLSESLQNDKGYTPSVYGDELLELKKKYDARYVTILFTRSLIRSKKGTGARFSSVVGLLVHPILFVSMLVNSYMPSKSMDLIIGVVDLEENKLIYAHEYNYNLVDSEDLLKSQMYYVFKTMTK